MAQASTRWGYFAGDKAESPITKRSTLDHFTLLADVSLAPIRLLARPPTAINIASSHSCDQPSAVCNTAPTRHTSPLVAIRA